MLAGCVLVTLPLEFVLGARVYRRPRRLIMTLLPVVAIFALWDEIAANRGHWSYSEQYITGWALPGGLPVEELLFFIVVPICGLLTFEAVSILWAKLRARADA